MLHWISLQKRNKNKVLSWEKRMGIGYIAKPLPFNSVQLGAGNMIKMEDIGTDSSGGGRRPLVMEHVLPSFPNTYYVRDTSMQQKCVYSTSLTFLCFSFSPCPPITKMSVLPSTRACISPPSR